MLARAETVAVEKHRDEDDAAPCSARMEVRSISAGDQGNRVWWEERRSRLRDMLVADGKILTTGEEKPAARTRGWKSRPVFAASKYLEAYEKGTDTKGAAE
jgi:hypothetical protein